jgi:U3 small nucleolar RNA-associated protein MPP10
MDDEQIWAQLELRAKNLADVLEYALEGTGQVGESDDESEGSAMKQRKGGVGEVDDEEMDMEDYDMDGMGSDEDEDSEDMNSDDEDEEDGEEDDDEGEEAEGYEEEYGEDVAELRDPSDGEGDMDLDAVSSKKRKSRGKARGKGHPELDDGFFDLAAFNAETEAAEARASSRGKLGRDDDTDDEDADFEDVDLFTAVDDVEDPEGDEQGTFAVRLSLPLY